MHAHIRRRLAGLGLLCALTPLLAQPSRAAESYDINVVLPLTGAAAFLGTSEQRALQQFERTELARTGIGGRPVHFVFHDDQSSPQTAVQLATQVASSKPAVVLGSGVVGMCNAMAPLMRRGPVQYCFSPGLYPAVGSFTFSSGISTRDLAATQLRYFRGRGLTRIAIITSTDASGTDALKHLKELAALEENREIQIVAETTFNPADVSAAAQMQRLKAAQPQALIAWSTGAAIGTVFKAILDAGLDIPVATTNGNMTYAFMERFADVLPKQLYIPSAAWPQTTLSELPASVDTAKRQFFAAFEGSGIAPDAASTFAWDPALLVVSALRTLGPDATAEQLRDYLAKLQGFAGVNGIYEFPRSPQRGLNDSSVIVTRWDSAAKTWTVVSHPRGQPLE